LRGLLQKLFKGVISESHWEKQLKKKKVLLLSRVGLPEKGRGSLGREAGSNLAEERFNFHFDSRKNPPLVDQGTLKSEIYGEINNSPRNGRKNKAF